MPKLELTKVIFFLLIGLFVGCKNRAAPTKDAVHELANRDSEKMSKSYTYLGWNQQIASDWYEPLRPAHKATPEISEEELEKYFSFDTLLIKEYISDNGHKIKLEGSKSESLYRISVVSNKGIKRKFLIAENPYIALHSNIIWDNDNYIFLYYGCGTECWGGKVLPLNDTSRIREFDMYFYADSVDNIIAYLDINDLQSIIIKNFSNNKAIKRKLNFCKESANRIWAMDTVYRLDRNNLVISYKDEKCRLVETQISIGTIKK